MENRPDETQTSKFMLWLAALSTVLFFVYIFCVTFMTIPKENIQVVNYALGFLSGTLISTIYNYYFGSSASSKSKDKTIQTMTDNNAQTSGNGDNGDSDGGVTSDDNSASDDDDLTPPLKG